jgi:putative transposase
MRRPLRVEYPGAIYHVMCRGNARQKIFREDADHQRLLDGMALTVSRLGWEILSFVLMPNHFHLLTDVLYVA